MRLCAIILNIVYCQLSNGQEHLPKIIEVKDKKVIETLITLNACENFSSTDFHLDIFKKNNPYGSAKNDSGEITHSYFFIISDSDDFPKQTVFEIGEFYGPEISKVTVFEARIEVSISYYSNYKKVEKTYKVYQHRVTE